MCGTLGDGFTSRVEYSAFSSLIGAFLHPNDSRAADIQFDRFFNAAGGSCYSLAVSMLFLLVHNP
jgi:hypothetical protein